MLFRYFLFLIFVVFLGFCEISYSSDRVANFNKIFDFMSGRDKYINSDEYVENMKLLSLYKKDKNKNLKKIEEIKKLLDFVPYLPLAIKVYREDPSDDAGYKTLVFVVKHVEDSNSKYRSDEYKIDPEEIKKIRDEAFYMLRKHHYNRKDLWLDFYREYRSDELEGESANKFLQSVIQENPYKEVRGAFTYFLAKKLMRKIRVFRYDKYSKSIKKDQNYEYDLYKLRAKTRFYANILLDDYEGVFVKIKKSKLEDEVVSLQEKARGILFNLDHLVVGSKIPNLTLKRLDGGVESISLYEGKVLLLNFWATWCVPCIEGLGVLRDLKKELEGKPFEIISISVDDDISDVLDFQSEESMPWANWFAGIDNPILTKWNISFYPTYILVDSQGVIQSNGYFGTSEIKLLRELMEGT